MTMSGDSGSIVCLQDGTPVGMHIAENTFGPFQSSPLGWENKDGTARTLAPSTNWATGVMLASRMSDFLARESLSGAKAAQKKASMVQWAPADDKGAVAEQAMANYELATGLTRPLPKSDAPFAHEPFFCIPSLAEQQTAACAHNSTAPVDWGWVRQQLLRRKSAPPITLRLPPQAFPARPACVAWQFDIAQLHQGSYFSPEVNGPILA